MKREILVHRTNHENGSYVQIANSLAQDYDILSAEAFGWLVRILSRPPDWKLIPKTLIEANKPRRSKNHIYSVLRELRDAGFIVTVNRRVLGRWNQVTYHVFDRVQAPEQIAALTGAETVSPNTVSRPTVSRIEGQVQRQSNNKDRVFKKDTAYAVSRRADAQSVQSSGVDTIESETFDPIDPDTGLSQSEIQAAERQHEDMRVERGPFTPKPGGKPTETRRNDKPRGDDDGQASFALAAEDENQLVAGLPWPRIEGAMKRIVPQIAIPAKADRRNAAMLQFWKKYKTIGAFEELARKVQESDFLMARNGHEGRNKTGKPYPWSWMFSKKDSDWRFNLILDGFYSNEAMSFVPDKNAKSKLTKVIFSDASVREVDLKEQYAGQPRYRLTSIFVNGVPEALDIAG